LRTAAAMTTDLHVAVSCSNATKRNGSRPVRGMDGYESECVCMCRYGLNLGHVAVSCSQAAEQNGSWPVISMHGHECVCICTYGLKLGPVI